MNKNIFVNGTATVQFLNVMLLFSYMLDFKFCIKRCLRHTQENKAALNIFIHKNVIKNALFTSHKNEG